MLENLAFLGDYFVILASIILTQTLVLNIIFLTKAKGYMVRAATWIPGYLLLAILIEFILAAIIYNLGLKLVSLSGFWWAIAVGVFAVFLPGVFEHLTLFLHPSEDNVKSPFVKILQTLNLDITHKFAWAIRSRMQQDAFDCQTGWGLGIKRHVMGRKLRMLYAHHKKEIARNKKNLSLLARDVGFTPWEHFYLLAEHLGRRALRKQLQKQIPPIYPLGTWDGSERRKQPGSKTDRLINDPDDPCYPHSRCIDHDSITEGIAEGRD